MAENGNVVVAAAAAAATTASKMEEEEEEEPPTAAAAPPLPPRFRSAIDYANESSLRTALNEPPCNNNSSSPPKEIKIVPCVLLDDNLSSLCCDWQSNKLDLSTSHPHSMEDEVLRLMELKEYAILDSEHEEKFERITALASRIFEAPICLVSLVDIGRQWFKSNRGLGEVRETSRELSFCAHAIHSIQDVFIIPDTHDDPRFQQNGLVTSAPFIRFYAGAPLVTPGGYKLGTFCIIDRKPRPSGLTLAEKQNLRELTEMVMDTMVHRKKEMEHLMDEKTRLIACAAHDLLSPLTGIQLNLGLLMEDEALWKKLDESQRELMEASVECSHMIERISVHAIESFRGDLTRANKKKSLDSNNEDEEDGRTDDSLVNVDQLIDSIERVIGTYPKKVPFFIEKNENVPPLIVSDDLKLFRSILNYLTNACKHTQAGSIRLRIYVRKAAATAATTYDDSNDSSAATEMELDLLPGALVAPKRDIFVMEVHDTGPGIDLEKYPTLFTPLGTIGSTNNEIQHHHHSRMTNSGLGLYSVATEISSLGGEYGVFPRQDLVASHDEDNNMLNQNLDHEPSVNGCVFWCSVPLVLPQATAAAAATMTPPPSVLDVKMASLEMNKTKNNNGVVVVTKSSRNSETATVMPDDSKLMPAPEAKSAKRSFDTTIETNTDTITATTTTTTAEYSDSNSSRMAKKPKRTKRALIIDDSLTIRKGLARGFSRLGFEVDEAENGLQGFKKLKADYYELVLLDFLMPVMDGPDVARKFREWEKEHRPDFHQYIIGISAHANGKDAELGIKAGMDRFMGKPVPLKSLKDLAQCKQVMEASVLLDMKFRKSCDAIEAATARSDEGGSRSSRSSVSSTTSTFAKHSCLIVTKEMDPTLHSLQHIVEKNGWRAVVKYGGGEDALRLLKLRNWDTVFIDNDLPILSGINCLVRFRDWEKRSRAVQQKNIFIISDNFSHHSLPNGFDGVLGRPVDPSRVLQILDTASEKFKFNRASEILLR